MKISRAVLAGNERPWEDNVVNRAIPILGQTVRRGEEDSCPDFRRSTGYYAVEAVTEPLPALSSPMTMIRKCRQWFV